MTLCLITKRFCLNCTSGNYTLSFSIYIFVFVFARKLTDSLSLFCFAFADITQLMMLSFFVQFAGLFLSKNCLRLLAPKFYTGKTMLKKLTN